MSHLLTLDVPSEVYESLHEIAERAGQSPEMVVIKWLTAATGQCLDDPMENFIGAWRSNKAGWPEQHDAYLGKAIVNHPTDAKSDENNG